MGDASLIGLAFSDAEHGTSPFGSETSGDAMRDYERPYESACVLPRENPPKRTRQRNSSYNSTERKNPRPPWHTRRMDCQADMASDWTLASSMVISNNLLIIEDNDDVF